LEDEARVHSPSFFQNSESAHLGSIFIWTSIFIVGVAIQTGTIHSIVQISSGRFIAGLGVGALSAIVPLYNGEMAPKTIRGSLLAMYQLQIMAGYVRHIFNGNTRNSDFFSLFVAYCIALGTHTINNSASWRIPIGIQMLVSHVFRNQAT
jgi:MFS transporter, SP family, sugar:H+ symporter